MEPLSILQYTRPDSRSTDSLVGQIYADLRDAMATGAIASGTQLPSSRQAAKLLGVSRNTVNSAYDLLRAEGLIKIPAQRRPIVIGNVTVPLVAPNARAVRRGTATPSSPWSRNYHAELYTDRRGAMAPGRPDPTQFPHDLWARALRRVSRKAFDDRGPHSLPALQEELTRMLTRDRGMTVEPDHIIVTSGTQASLALVSLVLAKPGDTVLMEDPSYLGARAAMQGAGLSPIPLQVDAGGARVPSASESQRASLIYLTPSNQYPLGRRLPLARRLAFIDHARLNGAIVLEDDYDSEFHWRGREIAAMHALSSGEEVIYMGTASKSLASATRLAWMVVPPSLVAPLERAQRNLGMGVNIHVQAAFAEWLASGEHRAHLRRITRTYAARGKLLAERLTQTFGEEIELVLPDGGLQLALVFKGNQNEDKALAALDQAGFSPERLSALCIERSMTGLVVGFADATEERIDRFCQTLTEYCERTV